ncbi:hypothetical protein BDQ12DRAFT_498858 [Crucibulum laeve]|uniref:Uncharacterized protein n=1 Tax=Crucibulum laeve TaxID=68775 RepID=A0A5C3LHN6_9AGAR|nr:hypothetical protein BDQ12DRAFT_498858 [Crucibulum laeve]
MVLLWRVQSRQFIQFLTLPVDSECSCFCYLKLYNSSIRYIGWGTEENVEISRSFWILQALILVMSLLYVLRCIIFVWRMKQCSPNSFIVTVLDILRLHLRRRTVFGLLNMESILNLCSIVDITYPAELLTTRPLWIYIFAEAFGNHGFQPRRPIALSFAGSFTPATH